MEPITLSVNEYSDFSTLGIKVNTKRGEYHKIPWVQYEVHPIDGIPEITIFGNPGVFDKYKPGYGWEGITC